MSEFAEAHFRYEDDPDVPGWKRRQIVDQGRFNSFIGTLSVKLDGKIARVRTIFRHQHSNLRDHIHGGAIAGFIDMAFFAAGRSFGVVVQDDVMVASFLGTISKPSAK